MLSCEAMNDDTQLAIYKRRVQLHRPLLLCKADCEQLRLMHCSGRLSPTNSDTELTLSSKRHYRGRSCDGHICSRSRLLHCLAAALWA